MPKLDIRFNKIPGEIPTVNDLRGYKFGYNLADAALYGIKIVGGIETVYLLNGGTGPGGSVLVYKEIPTGAVDGVNNQFVLSHRPDNISLIFVFLNGFNRHDFTYDYTSKTITLDFVPVAGGVVAVQYFVAVEVEIPVSSENFELELTRKPTGDSFADIIKVGSQVTQIDYWSDAAKTIKAFTKVFNYTGSVLDSVVTTDEVTGKVHTVTFTHTLGEVTNIGKEVV